MTRLIDADKLISELEKEVELADDWKTAHELFNVVKCFPTVEERPHSKCKNCKAYRQYGSRADGYCDISRMTPEGMSHINVSEDFYCSYFEEADNDKGKRKRGFY